MQTLIFTSLFLLVKLAYKHPLSASQYVRSSPKSCDHNCSWNYQEIFCSITKDDRKRLFSRTNPEVSLPRSFCIPREILPQNFSSLGLTALEELWNKQTHKLTNILLQNIFYHSKHVWLFWALSVQHLRSRRNIHSKFWDCIFKGEILKFWMMIPFGLQMVLV